MIARGINRAARREKPDRASESTGLELAPHSAPQQIGHGGSNGGRASKRGQDAWQEFVSNGALLGRHAITLGELEVLKQVARLEYAAEPEHFIFILNAIRQAAAPSPSPAPSETQLNAGGASVVKRGGGETRTLGLFDSIDQPLSEIEENTFRREGDFWTLIFEGRILRLRHSNGLVFVAHLLRHPDHQFHVTQLVALLPSARAIHAEAAFVSRSDRKQLAMHSVLVTDSNPLLDATAKAEYRRRIEELRDALEQAKAFNDDVRAADLEKELEFIVLELSRAVGAGGRDRNHRAENERARVNVTNAIRKLNTKIASENPSFARYLRLNIRTGRFCFYRPDPSSPKNWRF
jgi:hypothetical protein